MSVSFITPEEGSSQAQPVTITWGSVKDCTLYSITIATDPAFSNIVWAGESSTNSIVVSGLASGTEHFVKGRAFPFEIAAPILSGVNSATDVDRVAMYRFDYEAGIGEKYEQKIAGTYITPVRDVAFTPNGKAMVWARQLSLIAYRWSHADGHGLFYSSPNHDPYCDNIFNVDFKPTGDAIVVSHDKPQMALGTRYSVSSYGWNDETGFGPKHYDPYDPLDGIRYVRFHPTLNYVFFCRHGYGGGYGVYSWGANNDGCEYIRSIRYPTGASEAENSGNLVWRFDINKTGTVMLVRQHIDPYIVAVPWAPNAFGVQYPNPTIAFPGGSSRVRFSPSNKEIIFSDLTNDIRKFIVYDWDITTGFGTKHADTIVSVPLNHGSLTFLKPAEEQALLGDVFLVGVGESPWLAAYRWDNGVGVKYADPISPHIGNDSHSFSFQEHLNP